MQYQTFAAPPGGANRAGGKGAPSTMEVMKSVGEAFSAALMDGLDQLQASKPSPRSHAHRDECVHDRCHCDCCIADADLIVYARLGERRVVPVIIENRRRRERPIRLALSDWTSRRGRPSGITGQIVGPNEFTLPPCEEYEIVIVIEAKGVEAATAIRTEAEAEIETEDAKKILDKGHTRLRLADVDECEVFYADLRVEGCEIRPIRIALALLPRDCGAYRAECVCACC
jgi:hypothetical protein